MLRREDKPLECFHKITGFQSHKQCTLQASICENKCQSYHSHTLSIFDNHRIYLQYKAIKSSLTQKIKSYSDQFAKQYEDLLRSFQKKYTQDLREMQKQLLSELIDNVCLNREILQKLENERPQKIKCNQVFNFMQDLTLDKKIKKADLLPIYEKHISNLRVHLNGLKKPQNNNNPFLSKQQSQQGVPTYEQMGKQLAIYKQRVKEMKFSIDNLQQEISILKKPKKNGRLSLNTWNVIKVITKKRLKRQKINRESKSQSETAKPLDIINQNQIQLQDIHHYLQKKKIIS